MERGKSGITANPRLDGTIPSSQPQGVSERGKRESIVPRFHQEV